ncbi:MULTISPECIES: glutaredoxin family protein [Thalassotalea]|uniref:Glutaredoxin family protein n=1 Tax=Thalassotalea castellviae TaxID=3075612 RepID=A0ABU2ZYL7_9GAMM|nr:glutaredoxin family protein [Thalassotalea sp. W431]MDT0601978.1 glutaredoxin family protein [Thalassotalea sp. W431]
MTIKYHLYSSVGCHLCEQAIEIFSKTSQHKYLKVIDIVDNPLNQDNLVDLYGMHIPVLERLSDNHQLFWPFDIKEITAFIQEN